MSLKLHHAGLGLNLDNSFSVIHGLSLPGLSGGLPDEVNQGSLYVSDSDGSLWRKILEGSGNDKWREISTLSPPKSLNNVTSSQVVDYFKTSEVNVCKWIVEASLSSDKTNKYVAEITVLHNGDGVLNATTVDYNEYGILKLGQDISGLNILAELSGSGSNQVVQLKVSASVDVNVLVRRLNYGEQVGTSVPLDLTTVPHDISSTILGSVVANEPILIYVPSRSFKIPANFTNSVAFAEVAGTEQTTFLIQTSVAPYESNVEIGSITFSANSKVGTFSSSPAITINAASVLRILSPATPSASLKNLCVTIQASYN